MYEFLAILILKIRLSCILYPAPVQRRSSQIMNVALTFQLVGEIQPSSQAFSRLGAKCRDVTERHTATPGGLLNKVLSGEAPPRGPTPYPFIYHF